MNNLKPFSGKDYNPKTGEKVKCYHSNNDSGHYFIFTNKKKVFIEMVYIVQINNILMYNARRCYHQYLTMLRSASDEERNDCSLFLNPFPFVFGIFRNCKLSEP